MTARPKVGPIDAEIGRRVLHARITADKRQEDIAILAGFSPQQLSKIERGWNRIAAGRLYRIATGLGIPIQRFFPGEELP